MADKSNVGRCPNCARMIDLRPNGEVDTHYRGTYSAFQCGGSGQPPDTRSDLERAEGHARWCVAYAEPNQNRHMSVLMVEYDRRGAEVERLAARVANLRAALAYLGTEYADAFKVADAALAADDRAAQGGRRHAS